MPLTDLNDFLKTRQPTYYDMLVERADDIVAEVERTNMTKVAKTIGMSLPKFSVIYPLIEAIHASKTFQK